VVKQAMMQTQDPEIQAKLAAMQKQMQQKEGGGVTISHDHHADPDYYDEQITIKPPKPHPPKPIPAKSKLSQEQKDDAARLVCSLIKHCLSFVLHFVKLIFGTDWHKCSHYIL
jgi:Zn-dependent M16 (insulinase) family peptidase